MEEHEKELRIQMSWSYLGTMPNDDFMARPIFVMPFDGSYGMFGLIISISGSPPKGSVICFKNNSGHWKGWFFDNSKMRLAFDTSASSSPKKSNSALGKAVMNFLEIEGYLK